MEKEPMLSSLSTPRTSHQSSPSRCTSSSLSFSSSTVAARRSPTRKKSPRQKSSPKLLTPLSQKKRHEWLKEAEELHVQMCLRLEMDKLITTKSQSQLSYEDFIDGISINVQTQAERIEEQLILSNSLGSSSAVTTKKLSPLCSKTSSSLPLYKRQEVVENPTSPIAQLACFSTCNSDRRHSSPPKRTINTSLFSSEMQAKLRQHLEEKIQGNLWENEIRSRLARPLDATVFCERKEQLLGSLTVPSFVVQATASTLCATSTLYPYSIEAHMYARRIEKCYLTSCVRFRMLRRAHELAQAIQVFRCFFLNFWIIFHRTKKKRRFRAACKIQKQIRFHLTGLHQKIHKVSTQYIVQICQDVVQHFQYEQHQRLTAIKRIERFYHHQKQKYMQKMMEAKTWRQVKAWDLLNKWTCWTHIWVWFRKRIHMKRLTKQTHLVTWLNDWINQLTQIELEANIQFDHFIHTLEGKKFLREKVSIWKQERQHQNKQKDKEYRQVKETFDFFDADGSGMLEWKEFQFMMKRLIRLHPSKDKNKEKDIQEIRQLFDSFNQDQLERVSFEHFYPWYEKNILSVRQNSSHSSHSSGGGGGNGGGGNGGSSSSGEIKRNLLLHVFTNGRDGILWMLRGKNKMEQQLVKKIERTKAIQEAKQKYLTTISSTTTCPPFDWILKCTQCGYFFAWHRPFQEHSCTIMSTSTNLLLDLRLLKKHFQIQKEILDQKYKTLDRSTMNTLGGSNG